MTHFLPRRAFLAGLTTFAATGVSLVSSRASALCLRVLLRASPIVGVFEAVQAGDLEVKFVPKNAAEGNLLITNVSKRPLSVELPMGFAGMPVLAQLQPNGNGNNAQGQAVGVGFGPRNNNNANNNAANNFFMNIAPEKVGKLELELVCLEHGKPDPRPAMAYEIAPIEEFTPRRELQEFVRQFAQGKFAHEAAQAAAWNLADRMTWEELAALKVKRHATVYSPESPMVFSSRALLDARKIVREVEQAVALSKALTPAKSPGESP